VPIRWPASVLGPMRQTSRS